MKPCCWTILTVQDSQNGSTGGFLKSLKVKQNIIADFMEAYDSLLFSLKRKGDVTEHKSTQSSWALCNMKLVKGDCLTGL